MADAPGQQRGSHHPAANRGADLPVGMPVRIVDGPGDAEWDANVPVATPVLDDGQHPPVASGTPVAVGDDDIAEASVVAQPVWPEEGFGAGTQQATLPSGVVVIGAALATDHTDAPATAPRNVHNGGVPVARGHGPSSWGQLAGMRDKCWAVAFVAHVCVVVCCALLLGIPGIAYLVGVHNSEVVASASIAQSQPLLQPPPLPNQIPTSGTGLQPRPIVKEAWKHTTQLVPNVDPTSAVLADVMEMGSWGVIVGISVVVPLLLTVLWVWLLKHHATTIVRALIVGVAVLQAMGAMMMLPLLGPLGLVLVVLSFVFTFAWYKYLWRRIPLAATTLSCAITATTGGAGGGKTLELYVVYAVLAAARVAWVAVWFLCALGVHVSLTRTDRPATLVSTARNHGVGNMRGGRPRSEPMGSNDGDGPGVYLYYLLLLFSLTWGLAVLRSIGTVVVADVVSKWWGIGTARHWVDRNGVLARRRVATGAVAALARACTVSLGSVTFAASVVGILDALRMLMNLARHRARLRRLVGRFIRGNNNHPAARVAHRALHGGGHAALGCVACVGRCLLRCIQRIVGYITRYALIHVALTGRGFLPAARATFELFRARGWNAYINNRLVRRVLRFGTAGVTALTAAVLYVALSFLGLPPAAAWTAFGLGTLAAFAVAHLVNGVVDAAVATVFVCFAMDPVALSDTHPDEFQRMMTVWRDHRPQALRSAGYWGEGFARNRLPPQFFARG